MREVEKMIRERLKEMDLRITELADYLGVSRPTAYKFIDCYEQGAFDLINLKAKRLFDYIKENELVGKKNVVNYILSNLVEPSEIGEGGERGEAGRVKKYLSENATAKKSRFIGLIVQKDTFDRVIEYLWDIRELVGKDDLTDGEKEKLAPYLEIIQKI